MPGGITAARATLKRNLVFVVLAAALGSACSSASFTVDASGPFPDPAPVSPSMDRVAILVTVSNRSADDLQVNPADFVARDASHRIYPANAKATIADAQHVSGSAGLRGKLPMPVITLRNAEVLSGFVVFDVPPGVQPVELIWRQSDTDTVVNLVAARPASL